MDFPRWFKGDADAVDFAIKLWDAAQVWDDVHDEGDKSRIDELMQWLAFRKEYHPFFMRHPDILRTGMLMMFLQWQAANRLERSILPRDVEKAHMLRAGIYSVYVLMAWIVGGNTWADEICEEIYGQYGETIADLKREMA